MNAHSWSEYNSVVVTKVAGSGIEHDVLTTMGYTYGPATNAAQVQLCISGAGSSGTKSSGCTPLPL